MSSEPITEVVRRRPRLTGVRVLLVEDDPDTREMVVMLLREAGAVVDTASSADSALRAFERQGCDIVLTDFALPGAATGYQLLQQIRRQPVDRDVPVVGYSAHAGMVTPEQQAGFTAYMSKPLVLDELVNNVARIVAGSRRG
jgi:CheY-like chemotaxis protein